MRNLGLKDGFEMLANEWKRYFKIIGVDFNNEHYTRKTRLLNITAFALVINFSYQCVAFIVSSDVDVTEKPTYLSILCFNLAATGRLLTFVIGKNEIMHCIERFRDIYPSRSYVERYNLQNFVSQFWRMERFVLTILHTTSLFYFCAPIFLAFLRYMIKKENFELTLLFDFYYPFSVTESWLTFLLVYVEQMIAGYIIALIIFACDFCLYCLVVQLCMHFDLIGKRIREIDAAEENAEEKLKKLISYHKDILDLCDTVNRIFAPSLTYNLLSTCFILCMNGYQLLDDMSLFLVIRTILVLCFELKQVVITCYYGEKLIENSERLFFQLYDHNWYDGSKRYRKLVLIAMCRMRYPSALNVAKISELNLEKLKFVLTNSYQAFTVLKATK